MSRLDIMDAGPSASTAATIGIARPAAGRLALSALLGAGAIGATIALMGTSAWMLSRAAQRPGEAALGLSIVLVQLFGLSRGFLRYGERIVGHDAAFRLLASLRVRFYDHVESLAPSGLPAFSRGELLSRMVADVDGIQELLLRVIPPFATAAVVGAATVAVLWAVLPAAGAVTLVALLTAAIVVPWITSHLARRTAHREAGLRGELSASFVDLVEGAAELTVLGATEAEVARVTSLDATLTGVTSRGATTTGVGLALTTALAGLAATGNLLVGTAAVHGGRLHGVVLGTLAVVPLAAFELVAPLPGATQALRRARRCSGRIFSVLETPAPVVEPDRPCTIGPSPHLVRLEGVWASYPSSTSPVLRGIDLELRPGSVIGVVGPSGSGKSTLAAVLEDFLTPTAGMALLDGKPFSSYASDDVRGVIGLVDQLPHLFTTSLAANLRIARPNATDDELIDALDTVGLGEFVAGLPAGLATEVGAFGSRLSGGQRQRVGVARALLADWPVVILDEPTEHLETAAADALVDTVIKRAAARATVLITHRLLGLERADEIVVLDNGAVEERGTHAQLLAAAGRYAAWWWEERATDVRADDRTVVPRPGGVAGRAISTSKRGGTTRHG